MATHRRVEEFGVIEGHSGQMVVVSPAELLVLPLCPHSQVYITQQSGGFYSPVPISQADAIQRAQENTTPGEVIAALFELAGI